MKRFLLLVPLLFVGCSCAPTYTMLPEMIPPQDALCYSHGGVSVYRVSGPIPEGKYCHEMDRYTLEPVCNDGSIVMKSWMKEGSHALICSDSGKKE